MSNKPDFVRMLVRAALRDGLRPGLMGPKRRKPRPDKGGLADPLPVEPNRPNNLTGGAAAALEFDD